jgi:hypothetical protein
MKTTLRTHSTVRRATLKTLPVELLVSLLLSSWEEMTIRVIQARNALRAVRDCLATCDNVDSVLEQLKEAGMVPRITEAEALLSGWRPWAIFFVSHYFLNTLTNSRALLILAMQLFTKNCTVIEHHDDRFYHPHLIEARLFFNPVERKRLMRQSTCTLLMKAGVPQLRLVYQSWKQHIVWRKSISQFAHYDATDVEGQLIECPCLWCTEQRKTYHLGSANDWEWDDSSEETCSPVHDT